MKPFRLLVPLLVVALIATALHQLYLYSSQREILQSQRTDVARLFALIQGAMYQESTLRQQLREAEEQYLRLRTLLPAELATEQLEQQIMTLADKYGIKILSSSIAINSRPGYREALIGITLEAGTIDANRFMRELKSIPRRIHIIPPERRGKKSINLDIAIYAVSLEAAAPPTLPHCTEMPWGVWLPPLRERLIPLYQSYLEQCQFVTSYGEYYLLAQQLEELQQNNRRLSDLEQQLRDRP